MAYLRGDHYVWADGSDRLHIWVHDGEDGWRETWTTGADGSPKAGYENASGVSIPEAVMDEYVVMRFAELVASQTIDETIERALRFGKNGNFGSQALAERADAIKAIVRGL